MFIKYGFDITIVVDQATPVLTLLDIHPDRRGSISRESPMTVGSVLAPAPHVDLYGNFCRRIVLQPGDNTISLAGVIADSGWPEQLLTNEPETPVQALPAEVLPFLLGSRYCETDELATFAWAQFGHLPAGAPRVRAVLDYVHARIKFGYEFARATRTAKQALDEGVGVCRDFAHAVAALCRCLNIPARYVNGYLGDIGVPADPAPMDFNAWVEVYVDGRWFTVDARHNTPRVGRIMVARGRDAMDIPMLQTFGKHTMKKFSVVTQEDPASLTARCAA